MGTEQVDAQYRLDGAVVAGGRNGHLHVGLSSLEAARIAGYKERFQANPSGLFTERTPGDTPMLTAFREELGLGPRRIIDVGAGSGRQAIFMARHGQHLVLAVEPNAQYTGIEDNIGSAKGNFRNGSDVVVVPRPISEHLAELESGSIDGVHGQSIAHLWDLSTRQDFYGRVHRVLSQDGILALSFKTIHDAQRGRGQLVGVEGLGVYEQDPQYPEIVRLFIEHPELLLEEISKAGFKILRTLGWGQAGYDFPDRPELKADFFAVLAQVIPNRMIS